MTLLRFGFVRSGLPQKRQWRRSPMTKRKPALEHLEDRCLLTTYTTPASFMPVAEMVYGPAGDLWFSRLTDLSITRIASDGTAATDALCYVLGKTGKVADNCGLAALPATDPWRRVDNYPIGTAAELAL